MFITYRSLRIVFIIIFIVGLIGSSKWVTSNASPQDRKDEVNDRMPIDLRGRKYGRQFEDRLSRAKNSVGVVSQNGNREHNSRTEINPLGASVAATIPVGLSEIFPFDVAVNPTTNRIYVVNLLSENISVIDGTTNAVIAMVKVGFSPISVAVNPSTNRIYTANVSGDSVSVIDGATNTLIDMINVGDGPRSVAVNPITNLIYTADYKSDSVSVIDGAINTLIDTINVGDGPRSVAVNPITNFIYTADYKSDSVSVIDGATNTLIDTINVGDGPRNVAVNPTANLIYTADYKSNSVSVIDGESNAVAAITILSGRPISIEIDSNDGRIYVTTKKGRTVSILLLPTITGFSPASGSVGTNVTINGTNLNDATRVTFAGVNALFNIVSSTTINAVVPSGAFTGRIAVTNPTGTAVSSNNFTVFQSPRIISFSPTSGSVNTKVRIEGSNFTGATRVTFNGVNAAFGDVFSSSLNATVPSGATTGPIVVTTPGGAATSTSNFTVILPPTITGFSPSSGPTNTSVSISGTNFTGVTRVTFNGQTASFSVFSSTNIRANVPSGATSGPIAVTTSAGTAVSSNNFTVTQPTPRISFFTPSSGVVGARIRIDGSNFTGTTSVTFNGANAAFSDVSFSSITATVPSGATTGPISVTTPGGIAASSNNFTVIQPPTITGFSPTSGPAGTRVRVNGTNFTGATRVAFNGVGASFGEVFSTSLLATVPSGAATGPVAVTTSAGTAVSSNNFTVIGSPKITGFSPTIGPVGAAVTINGENFTDATSLTFNGVNASFGVLSSSTITATVPPGASTGSIAVSTRAGTAFSSNAFTVVSPPRIFSFSPTSGRAGTKLTINGDNFTFVTSVTFNGVSAAFTDGFPTLLFVTVPAGATTGPIAVTTPAGTVVSSNNFTVILPPVITGFSPTSGAAGTRVTISGMNFAGVTRVTFNEASASFNTVSSTSISATVPSGATTGSIVATNSEGSAVSPNNFTVITRPAILGFSPTSGPTGTTVSITGSGFTGATSVRFNGANAAFNVASDSSILAVVPSNASTGSISVDNPAGSAASSNVFIVTAPDFSLGFNEQELTVFRGQTGRLTINIIRTGGFRGLVTIQPPATKGLKVKISPLRQGTTGDMLEFDIVVKKRALVGMSPLTFTGQDESGRVRNAALTLVIR